MERRKEKYPSKYSLQYCSKGPETGKNSYPGTSAFSRNEFQEPSREHMAGTQAKANDEAQSQ